MKVSIVIATYGRETCLVDTIQGVLAEDYSDFELLVVDQSPNHQPEVAHFLKTQDDPRYRYYLVSPPSLPAARNFGAAAAHGEIVIYIDDDVVLERNFIAAHVEAYAHSPKIAGVGGRVRNWVGEMSDRLPILLDNGRWKGGFNYDKDGELLTTIGCNMSFRRSVLTEVGGFDTSFEGNALREESDLCFRIRKHGYKLWFAAHALLIHLDATTGGCREKVIQDTRTYYQNETLFNVKNRSFRNCLTVGSYIFINNVWPFKSEARFWSRLNAFCTGVTRGLWFMLFPKKLHSICVSNRIPAEQLHEKVAS